ncbi:MAG: hypothetical protein AB7G28_26545 [Pirellulales bacterium]
MQLKNTLIGAIIGGLVGIGVLVAAYMFFEAQHTALALVVAALVGAGVRAMVSTKGHASYVRGALTALVAIAAYVGGNMVVAKVAQSNVAANASLPMHPAPPPKQQEELAATAEDAADAAPAEQVAEAVEARRPELPMGNGVRQPRSSDYSPMDFILLSIAALVAYELGRGSGTSPVSNTTLPEAPATPAATA